MTEDCHISTLSFDRDAALFGWSRPFDLYDPKLPISVAVTGGGYADVTITAGCKLSTLIAALQARGMEKPGD